MWDVSAFSLTAVKLRTDRHQHHENNADRQNDEAVDGRSPLLEQADSLRDSIRIVYLDLDSQSSLSGSSCLVEAEREASSAETDDQNKKIRGAKHKFSAGKQTLSGSLQNVKRISVAAFTACLARIQLDSSIHAFGGCAFPALSAKCPVFDSS